MTILRAIKVSARTLVVVASFFNGVGPSAFAAKSISQFGITWRFDRDYPSGQFANGDYWVVGPVRIVSISPASTTHGQVTMHGSMVNPKVNSVQGYDSRIKRNKFSNAANVGDDLPLVVPAGSSLLSAESYPKLAKGDNPQLKTIAILTVLSRAAPAGSFRPPPVGSNKSLKWSTRQLNYAKLASLPSVPAAPKLASVEALFERPWIEQGTTWVSRYLHPKENQPGYGREIAHTLAQGLLSLQLNYSKQRKETLLIRLVQYGLDVYGSAREGATWPAGGGHNHGRKMPLLLAGTVLGDPDILAYADGQKRIFQEDRQTWYVSPSDVGRKLHDRDGRPRDRYLTSDIGLAEWGEKHHPSPEWDGRNWNSFYRTVAGSSTIGHVLTARLMNLEKTWNWPAIFDYYDRYWAKEKHHAGRGQNSIALFVAQMWERQLTPEPAEFNDENVSTQVWQNIPLKDQTKSFAFSFDLLPSSEKMNGITGLSDGVANEYADLSASVRFSPAGYIDARNGNKFEAAKKLRYSAGVRYRVVMAVNVATNRYSVSVTPAGGSRVLIANNWKFRTTRKSTDRLNNLGFHSKKGYHAVLDPTVQAL